MAFLRLPEGHPVCDAAAAALIDVPSMKLSVGAQAATDKRRRWAALCSPRSNRSLVPLSKSRGRRLLASSCRGRSRADLQTSRMWSSA